MEKMTFEDAEIEFIRIDNQIWVRGYQIGTALGYSDPDVAIRKIYQRNADEFTDSMTRLVMLPSSGGEQQTRVFSLRGAHLIAMFARTEKAKSFRRWVLDLIDDFLDGTENAKYRYMKAQKDFEEARQQASSCGSGLNRWKHVKPVLEDDVSQKQHQYELLLQTRL